MIEYAKIISRSKICLACTSKYKYRLGKYVEILLAGSVLGGDIPDDEIDIKNCLIELDMSMSDNEIVNKLDYYLTNVKELYKKMDDHPNPRMIMR